MLERLVKSFIIWVTKKVPRWHRQHIVSHEERSQIQFYRFAFLWPDEWVSNIDGPYKGKHYNRPPWYRPFNIFLHWWHPSTTLTETMHDHPRWSITICLRGRLVEKTPWNTRTLTPGSIVFRSRKAIHGFAIPEGYSGRTWTLFIAGRRNHRQNSYIITPRSK